MSDLNPSKSVCFFKAEEGIRDGTVTGVQTCALPISGDRTPECDECNGETSMAALILVRARVTKSRTKDLGRKSECEHCEGAGSTALPLKDEFPRNSRQIFKLDGERAAVLNRYMDRRRERAACWLLIFGTVWTVAAIYIAEVLTPNYSITGEAISGLGSTYFSTIACIAERCNDIYQPASLVFLISRSTWERRPSTLTWRSYSISRARYSWWVSRRSLPFVPMHLRSHGLSLFPG